MHSLDCVKTNLPTLKRPVLRSTWRERRLLTPLSLYGWRAWNSFFGIIPAEIVRGHASDHEERKMHGGVPLGKGVHHLVIAVFDSKTQARITDATLAMQRHRNGYGSSAQATDSHAVWRCYELR